jgi:hypothetical protein
MVNCEKRNSSVNRVSGLRIGGPQFDSVYGTDVYFCLRGRTHSGSPQHPAQ